jgi:hypothetical protein
MTTTEKTYRIDYTDVLFWLGIAIMVVWIIGKLAGLIHSPTWVETLPIIGALVAVLSIGLKGRALQKLDYVFDAVNELKGDMKEVKAELKAHDSRITAIEN